MLSTFKKLIGRGFVREVDDIMQPLNKIIAGLEENAIAAAVTGKDREAKADLCLEQAEEFRRLKESEAIEARQEAGQLYDTAAASVQRAEKLRGLFS